MSTPDQKNKTLIGFKKARSLLEKIIKMSEDGEYNEKKKKAMTAEILKVTNLFNK